MGEDEPELDDPEQDNHEDGEDQRELDERLTVRLTAALMPRRWRAHSTGSMRIWLDWTRIQPSPDSPMKLLRGVFQLS